MKIAEKIHAIVILAICLCLIFTGCDSESKNTANSDKVKDLINMPEAETITIMLPNAAGGSLPKEVIDEINARTRKAMNLTVEFDEAYEAFRGKNTAEIMKRKEFDAIVLWYNFSELAYQDVLMDLNELLPRYAPNLYVSLSEADKRFASDNGKLLAVPSHGARNTGTYFAVRSDIAKRCGITQISTIEDVDNALQTIRDKESIIPIYKDSVSPKILMGRKRFITLTSPFLYKKDDPTMKVLPIEQFDEYSRASALFIKWKNSGYFAEAGIDKTASFFANGLGIIDYYRKGKISGDYKLFGLYDDSDGIYENQEYVYGLAINKDSKKAEHVLRFLEWVYSEQSNYDLIMYGIEGKNFTLKNGKIVPDKKHGLINWYGSLSFLNYNFERLYENDPDFFKEIYKSFLISEYQMPPHYGFIPDLSKLYDKIMETRHSAEQQRISKAVFEGTSDMTISEYIQYQKDLGADDIVKELQTQLNVWLLKNKQ